MTSNHLEYEAVTRLMAPSVPERQALAVNVPGVYLYRSRALLPRPVEALIEPRLHLRGAEIVVYGERHRQRTGGRAGQRTAPPISQQRILTRRAGVLDIDIQEDIVAFLLVDITVAELDEGAIR